MTRMIILYTQRDHDLDRNYIPIGLSWSMCLESPPGFVHAALAAKNKGTELPSWQQVHPRILWVALAENRERVKGNENSGIQ